MPTPTAASAGDTAAGSAGASHGGFAVSAQGPPRPLLPPQLAARTYQEWRPAVSPATAQAVAVVVHLAVVVSSTNTEYVIGDVPVEADHTNVAVALSTVDPGAGLGLAGVLGAAHDEPALKSHGPPVALPHSLLAITRHTCEPITPSIEQLVPVVVQITLRPSSRTS